MAISKRRTSWLLALIAIIVAIGAGLSYTPGWWTRLRAPTERETVLYYFAQNIGEPAFCEKISWSAHQTYSVLFGGGGASFWRSDCFERVAQARDDASICWLVRPLVDFDPLSAGYSAVSCRRRTRSGYRSGIALGSELSLRVFEQLGYDMDQIHLEGVSSPESRLRDVYRGLERDAAVTVRARELLGPQAATLAPEDAGYLADLAAIGASDPTWCEYISMAQIYDSTSTPLRDWCYFTVAINSQNVRICERMTPAGEEAKVRAAKAAGVRPSIAEQLGLQSECLRSRSRVGPRPHYGPEVPGDPQQTRRLITALGVVLPSAHERLTADASIFYQQYVFALWPKDSPDPARDAARADLVRRLLALPGA